MPAPPRGPSRVLRSPRPVPHAPPAVRLAPPPEGLYPPPPPHRRWVPLALGGVVLAALALWLVPPLVSSDEVPGEDLPLAVAEPAAEPNPEPRLAPWQAAPGLPSAALAIETEPADAAVILGLSFVGRTPVALEDVRPGYHVVRVEGDAATVDSLLYLEPGERRTLRIVLAAPTVTPRPAPPSRGAAPRAEPAPPSPAEPPVTAAPAPPPETPTAAPDPPAADAPGRLVVQVRPWGTITVNGRVYARNTDLPATLELPPGTHRVRVEHPQLGLREQLVEVRPGQTTRVVLDLAPSDGP